MPFKPNHPLAWFMDDLYHIPERKQDTYSKNPKAGARFIASRRIKGLPAWQTSQNKKSPANIRRKKILLSDYAFSPSFDMENRRLNLLQDLAKEGFELTVLTTNNKLSTIDPKQINDLSYLRRVFAQAQFFQHNSSDPEKNIAMTKLKSCGEHNPEEEWYIFDNYSVEKILHIYQLPTSTHDPWSSFSSSITLSKNNLSNPEFLTF